MVTFSKSSYGRHLASQDCCCPCPRPCGRPLLTHASAGDPQTLTGRFGSVSPLPISWCTQGFRCALQGSMVSIKLTLSIIVHLLTSSYSFSSVLGCGALFFFFFWWAKFRLKLKKVGKTTRPFRYDLKQIPYDYTVEVRNRFKGLDLIECLMNYQRRFMALYRRQGARPSPRKRNTKKQNGWGGLTNSCEKKRN